MIEGVVGVVHFGKNSATPLRLPFQYGATQVDLVILSECNACGMFRKEPRSFCKEFGELQKVEVDFNTNDLPSPLSQDISICLFRVLQEALRNSAKHSGVRQFEVRLWAMSGEIHLTIADSGVGFNVEAAKESRGLGVVSMEERLKLLGGTFSVESQLHRGTTIRARVPLYSGRDCMPHSRVRVRKSQSGKTCRMCQ
jgi:signal transduction histidine kinase